MELSATETRVLGALMEKARLTPDVYPLTLNALLHACNQKTSRDPVTDFDEDEVLDALETLREKHLAMRVDMAGSRTAKFRENISRQWELQREEYALLTSLFLRGPQTPGQLRQRCERLYPFAELSQVNDWLQRMQKREEEPECLVQSLGRSPGTKEMRYAHTCSSVPAETVSPVPVEPEIEGQREVSTQSPPSKSLAETVRDLERRVRELEEKLDDLLS